MEPADASLRKSFLSVPSSIRCVVVLLVSLSHLLQCNHGAPLSYPAPVWNLVGKTRTITIKQGQLRGIVVAPIREPRLRNVEVYLGIPYAAPPVGSQRFMPPGSPPPWHRLKLADTMGPVCPQVLPEVDEDPRKTSSGRTAYLRRLLPYLRNQSEDCLHLNIYAPVQDFPLGPSKLPVIVFIHGESFQWNSGNPYDGSILASYTDVIVVTINFRLGILGFLKPGLEALSNFGLLDQIAALQWVKDNIDRFGGDPTSVTLLGHHTGAVAVNYLMLSPVVQVDHGLFHKAILMSGSALADWGEVRQPEQVTIQVAEALNCPQRTADLLACLRRKRVSDLLAVPLSPSQIGPTVDGNVIPNNPKHLMATYTELFSRYDLLCGITEAESYHMLDAVSLAHGMLDVERDKLLKEFFRNTFQVHPEMARAKATSVYSETEKGRSSGENTREATIGLLSDARVVAPVLQTALYHSNAASHTVKTFVYVFTHRSDNSEFPKAEKSVHGEEVPYVFGIPIDGPRFHFPNNYNLPEKLLSEVIMTLWSNFAKTGNPNHPKKYNYLTQTPREWAQYDTHWPEYEKSAQAYYDLAIPPSIEYKYRDQLIRFWNEYLPNFLLNPAQPEVRYPSRYPKPLIPPPGTWVPEDPRSYPDIWPFANPKPRPSNKPSYGVVRYHDENLGAPRPQPKKEVLPFDQHMDSPKPTEGADQEEHISTSSSFTLSIIILVGLCFLLVNIVSFLFIWYQKKKLRKEINMSARYRSESLPSLPDLEDRYIKKGDGDRSGGEVKSILKSSDGNYEPVKVKSERSGIAGLGGGGGRWAGMYRQGSSSTVTMDPHTKVTEWIAHEIVHRCSPSFLRRGGGGKKDKEADKISTATTSRLARIPGIDKKGVKKVSVAVDATPSTRSASVLKQIPIELTKSLENFGSRSSGLRPSLVRSEAIESEGPEDPFPPVSHGHSYSDPAVVAQGDPAELGADVNVTSRDEEAKKTPLSPEEALDNIKRRNFPKVLPDFPGSSEVKRLSMPGSPGEDGCGSKRVPPPPPPRVSTLGRRGQNRNTIPNFMNSYSPGGKQQQAKVVIKPTLKDPNSKRGTNPGIPRVVHHPLEADLTQPPSSPSSIDESSLSPSTPGTEDVSQSSPFFDEKTPEKLEDGTKNERAETISLPSAGVGAPVKIPPVKRTTPVGESGSCGGDTSESSVSTDDTVKEASQEKDGS